MKIQLDDLFEGENSLNELLLYSDNIKVLILSL